MEPNIPRRENDAQEAEIDQNDLIADTAHDRPFDDAVIILFNLDTTDLSAAKEICQISARFKDQSDQKFDQYIIPDREISNISAGIHKIQKMKIGNETKLCHYKKIVKALGPREGLIEFIDFLRNQPGKVLLAAHRLQRFHGPTLIRQLKKHDLLDTFQVFVLGFIDTSLIFKSMLPERQELPPKGRYKLEELAKDYLDASIPEGRHAAVKVEILRSLIATLGCTDAFMKKHAKNL